MAKQQTNKLQKHGEPDQKNKLQKNSKPNQTKKIQSGQAVVNICEYFFDKVSNNNCTPRLVEKTFAKIFTRMLAENENSYFVKFQTVVTENCCLQIMTHVKVFLP